MNNCIKCGYDNRDNAIFCANCGMKLSLSEIVGDALKDVDVKAKIALNTAKNNANDMKEKIINLDLPRQVRTRIKDSSEFANRSIRNFLSKIKYYLIGLLVVGALSFAGYLFGDKILLVAIGHFKISEREVLTELYYNYKNTNPVGATWLVEEATSDAKSELGKNKFVIPLTDYTYVSGSDQMKVYLTYAVNVDRNGNAEEEDCHACGVVLGAHIYKKGFIGWKLISSNKFMFIAGAWGKPPEVKINYEGENNSLNLEVVSTYSMGGDTETTMYRSKYTNGNWSVVEKKTESSHVEPEVKKDTSSEWEQITLDGMELYYFKSIADLATKEEPVFELLTNFKNARSVKGVPYEIKSSILHVELNCKSQEVNYGNTEMFSLEMGEGEKTTSAESVSKISMTQEDKKFFGSLGYCND